VDDADDENILTTITDAAVIEWYMEIFEKGNRSYEAAAFEWRKSTANIGGLTTAQVFAIGKRDHTPPGSPPQPPTPTGQDSLDWTYLKTGAQYDLGENSSSTDETWTWGYWPQKAYPLA
jgi:hypothetical protein